MFSLFSKPKPPSEPAPFCALPAELKVSVGAMDADHQVLADQLNLIHAAIMVDRDRSRATKLLEALLDQIRKHFNHEEKLLEEAGFPGLEDHANEHSLLLASASDLVHQFRSGTLSGLALPNLLKHWLMGHILDSDRKYAIHLRRKGIR